MENTKKEIVVADLTTLSIWTFAKTMESAWDGLRRALDNQRHDITMYENYIVEYPDNESYWKKQLDVATKKQYQIMDFKEFKAEERKQLLSGKPKRITKARFWEMLEVLPPLKWCTIDGVEMFCISEMYTGSYTNQYALDKKTNKYYTKMVDCRDKTTWINVLLRNKIVAET
jgi:hypothetical protein